MVLNVLKCKLWNSPFSVLDHLTQLSEGTKQHSSSKWRKIRKTVNRVIYIRVLVHVNFCFLSFLFIFFLIHFIDMCFGVY